MSKSTIWLNKVVNTAGVLLLCSFLNTAVAQDSTVLTLEQAYKEATLNYPAIKQRQLVKQTADINISNISKGYLPQFVVNGQATYQSDVTKVDIPGSPFKIDPLSKDQYKVYAEANQLIYDGGMIHERKVMQQLNADVEQQKVEVDLYSVKERINQLYLGILYYEEQAKQVELTRKDIESGIKRVDAQLQNGTAFRSNLDMLKAELLKADQRLIEVTASRKGFLATLGLFLNRELPQTTKFQVPVIPSFVPDYVILRPEMNFFSSQVKLAEHQTRMIQAKNLPTASFFVQGGYGRPGLNMLKNEFEPYYIGGVRLNWSLGGFYTRKKEIQQVEINKKMIDVQQETFVLNTNTQLKQQQAEVDKQRLLVDGDNKIIELRQRVTEASKAQLENGVITAIDYLQEVNAEDMARQTRIAHLLLLIQAQINYQTISGKQ